MPVCLFSSTGNKQVRLQRIGVFMLALFLTLTCTCTCTRSLTSHLQIDECLNLKVFSHLVAQRTSAPLGFPLELLSCRTAILAAFTSEIVSLSQEGNVF